MIIHAKSTWKNPRIVFSGDVKEFEFVLSALEKKLERYVGAMLLRRVISDMEKDIQSVLNHPVKVEEDRDQSLFFGIKITVLP